MARRQKRLKKSQRLNNVIQINDYVPNKTRKQKVEIIPRNRAQEEYIFSIKDNDITFGIGPAGTGKTIIATLMAIKALRENKIEKVIITRPAVSVDEQHGFLPGTLEEKMKPWTRPIFDIFEEYYSPKHILNMIEEGIIEISPLAYMRGRTFHNCWILADEFQNATISQTKMMLTRMGENSKMVVTGDLDQYDRTFTDNGLKDFVNRFENTSNHISVVRFGIGDIERSPIVAEVLEIYAN